MSYKVIGIDYSLNSPAFCVLDGSNTIWGSMYRTEKMVDKMLEKESSPFRVFTDTGKFRFAYIDKVKIEGEYHESERKKLDLYEESSDKFLGLFRDTIDENTYVFMEGISFGSPGKSLIDISLSTALLRSKLRYIVGSERLYIFSPTSIKKFGLKGNAKKDELYKALIEKKSGNDDLKFLIDPLKQNQEFWIKKRGTVETPCSDIIDATWISLFGLDFLEKVKK